MRIRPKAKLFELTDYNMEALANALGVSLCQVYRVKSGRRGNKLMHINEKFIVGALTAFPESKFEDLFYIDRRMR